MLNPSKIASGAPSIKSLASVQGSEDPEVVNYVRGNVDADDTEVEKNVEPKCHVHGAAVFRQETLSEGSPEDVTHPVTEHIDWRYVI